MATMATMKGREDILRAPLIGPPVVDETANTELLNLELRGSFFQGPHVFRAVSFMFAPPRFSSRRESFVVPGMGTIQGFFASSQASETKTLFGKGSLAGKAARA